VREGVEKNKVIADLESQITELNSEMDELKEENNANLSVINRLKDSLQETNTRLVCLDSDETGGCRSPSPPCLSSTASLPSLPSSHPNNNNNLITYSSKFARSLSRRSSRASQTSRLREQLETSQGEVQRLDHRVTELATQVELSTNARLQAESALLAARRELQELTVEHENLKDDFRALVRKREEKKLRRSSSTVGEETLSERRRQEGLEARLGSAIQQLRQREEEMEGVATCLDSVTIQLCEKEAELVGLRGRVGALEEQLAQQHQALLRQGADRQRTRSFPLPVRVIYKGESEVSGEEEEQSEGLSSSDSFNI